jgi:hypothetical protein
MAKPLDPKESATFEEVLLSNVYTQEALINVLEKKGLVSKKEIMAGMDKLRWEK